MQNTNLDPPYGNQVLQHLFPLHLAEPSPPLAELFALDVFVKTSSSGGVDMEERPGATMTTVDSSTSPAITLHKEGWRVKEGEGGRGSLGVTGGLNSSSQVLLVRGVVV